MSLVAYAADTMCPSSRTFTPSRPCMWFPSFAVEPVGAGEGDRGDTVRDCVLDDFQFHFLGSIQSDYSFSRQDSKASAC